MCTTDHSHYGCANLYTLDFRKYDVNVTLQVSDTVVQRPDGKSSIDLL